MQESNEEVLSDNRRLTLVAQSTCHPGGVPGQLLSPAEPFYVIQTPKAASSSTSLARARQKARGRALIDRLAPIRR